MAAGAVLLPAGRLAASLTTEGKRTAFSVLRAGLPIGRHVIAFERSGADLLVDIQIELEIKFAFFTVFRYQHRNRERWRDDRLITLDSETDDDGTPHWVKARATDNGLQIESDQGRLLAPAELMPTSYWNPRTIEQSRLLDTQRGGILEVAVQAAGKERLEVPQGPTDARLYRMAGDLNLDLWYGPRGELLKMAFEARGSAIEYAALETARPGAS